MQFTQHPAIHAAIWGHETPQFAAVTAKTALERAQAVAEAVLYEGYLLYPYRASSSKNRVRWQFGVLVPPGWADAHGCTDESVAGSVESSWQQTECLLEAAPQALLHIRLRFLQAQRRRVDIVDAESGFRPVERLRVGDVEHVGFEEAVPQEFDIAIRVAEVLRGEYVAPIEIPGGSGVEVLIDDDRHVAGRIVRQRSALHGLLTVTATALDHPTSPQSLLSLRIRTANVDTSCAIHAAREEVLHHSLIATHTLIRVSAGRFWSLLDPPPAFAATARGCRNVHTFPVLIGEPGDHDVVLSSPIILYDYVEVAPESPGDLHDATEIDEILSLRTLALTDDEKREARATDSRARAIVDRVDGLAADVLGRLHGAVRELRAAGQPQLAPTSRPHDTETPWWDPGADADVLPETDTLAVAGQLIHKGSSVRLHPRPHGGDPHDMFLDGRTACVQGVFRDVDDSWHIAVIVDDDPLAEIHAAYHRFRYYSPDEVEPLDHRVRERGGSP